jgi:hypothetical protein
MCANCGCGYASYDDIQTGAPANEPWPWTPMEEKREKTEAQ